METMTSFCASQASQVPPALRAVVEGMLLVCEMHHQPVNHHEDRRKKCAWRGSGYITIHCFSSNLWAFLQVTHQWALSNSTFVDRRYKGNRYKVYTIMRRVAGGQFL